MQWPWRKKVPVYVPVPSFGEYEELHGNKQYLVELAEMSKSVIWVAEMTQLLKEARECADRVATPEELKGVQKCVEIIKMRLVLSKYAKNSIDAIEAMEKVNKEE
jgi:hypothetical protein